MTPTTPWLNLQEAMAYSRRGRRILRREIRAGRLRAALVGERREVLVRREWIDEWLEALAEPVDDRQFSRLAR